MNVSLLKKQTIMLIFLLWGMKAESIGIDVRVAGFIPTSHLFRKIYGTINVSPQIEASWAIKNCFRVWSNLSYFNTPGKSVPLKNKVRLRLLPISAGLKYVYPLHHYFDVYVGAGLCYT